LSDSREVQRLEFVAWGLALKTSETLAGQYIPAFRFRWLTPLYDPLLRYVIREAEFKKALVEQAQVADGHRVLDLGCGTGTLTILIKESKTGAEVHGLDGDDEVLHIARHKAANVGAEIHLVHGLASALPYPDNFFDCVLSSLFFHHLVHEEKVRAAREVRRILRPGGHLHVADWGRPENALLKGAFLAIRMLDGFAATRDNVAGMLPDVFQEAGLRQAAKTAAYATVFGTLALYRAEK
jgi:SAM-dependent methyltransferase